MKQNFSILLIENIITEGIIALPAIVVAIGRFIPKNFNIVWIYITKAIVIGAYFKM
jgi:ABC-type Fe3+ transport system permease subunit